MNEVLSHLVEAAEDRDNSTNLLALAHFYLEQNELNQAQKYVSLSLNKSPESAVALLSQAVILWLMGQIKEAQSKLQEAQQKDRHVIKIRDLEYDHFWSEKAIEALSSMINGSP
ncbi:MAG: hypothetical protein R3A44_17895 [Caldilineaceae bacterium]